MAGGGRFHEDFGRKPELEPGSLGGFTFVMVLALGLIGAWLWRAGSGWAWPLLAVAALLPVLWRWKPQWLQPLNRAWFRLGLLLGAVVAPLVMGLIFYGVVTPIGLLRRVLGRDSLRRRFEPGAESYWIEREPPGPQPEQLERQF